MKGRYKMTKTLTENTTVSSLNKRVAGLLKTDSTFKTKLQKVIDDFVLGFESALSQNSTPMSTLLKGLRKTDATLVKEWFKRVTNGYLALNKNGNYVVRWEPIKNEAGKVIETPSHLVIKTAFQTLSWYDLAEKSETVVHDSFETDEKAIKAFENYFKKIEKSNFNKQKLRNIKDKIDELFADKLTETVTE